MTELSYALLATVLLMTLVQNLSLFVALVSLQATLLGVLTAWIGWVHGDPALYWAALLTVAVKGVAIPFFLRYIIRQIRVVRRVDALFTSKVTVLITIALTLVAYYATGEVGLSDQLEGEPLAVAMSMVLTGLFIMVSRRVALTQVLGMLVIENGLFLAALASSRGLPILVDVGILFDVLVGALVMGLMVFRINATFDSIDTEQLRRLRG